MGFSFCAIFTHPIMRRINAGVGTELTVESKRRETCRRDIHLLFFFGPFCNIEKRVWPTFIWVCLIFVRTFENFGPLFLTFGPLLFSKPGQRKRGNTNVCRHRGPLSHFFLLLNVIKNIINIYNRAN